MAEQRYMTNTEMLALAVLRGDRSAIPALIDATIEQEGLASTSQLNPITRSVTAQLGRLRAVFSTYPELGGDVDIERQATEKHFQRWLTEGEPMILIGMKMDLYEVPEEYGDATVPRPKNEGGVLT